MVVLDERSDSEAFLLDEWVEDVCNPIVQLDEGEHPVSIKIKLSFQVQHIQLPQALHHLGLVLHLHVFSRSECHCVGWMCQVLESS